MSGASRGGTGCGCRSVLGVVWLAWDAKGAYARWLVGVPGKCGRCTLEVVVGNKGEAIACADLATRLKGVDDVVNFIRVGNVPPRLRGE